MLKIEAKLHIVPQPPKPEDYVTLTVPVSVAQMLLQITGSQLKRSPDDPFHLNQLYYALHEAKVPRCPKVIRLVPRTHPQNANAWWFQEKQ